MILLSRRSLLGIAAVVDIAIHGRVAPVPAKALSERHHLPPRHLETMLQALVRTGILRGVRGPRGGYELAIERRKLKAGDIVRAAMTAIDDEDETPEPSSTLVDLVINPAVKQASHAFLEHLDSITVEDLCQQSEKVGLFGSLPDDANFTI